MSDFITASPKISVMPSGDGFISVVRFAPGLFAGRPAVRGPVRNTVADAIAAALALAAPVIADIVTPKVYPDAD